MNTTKITSPTSRVQFGWARVDVTPPVGIYHRLWGAARHDRATGVHRPLFGDVMVFGPADRTPPASQPPSQGGEQSTPPAPPSQGGEQREVLIRAQLDLCGLVKSQHEDLVRALSEAAGVPASRVVVTFSHTHSSGWFVPDRFELPGGELIAPYLQQLGNQLQQAGRQALASVQEVIITYATGRCSLAANRDCWDEAYGGYVCGLNPEAPADDTVLVARITDRSGGLVGVVVNYACHPTTLAWENTLISPDYVGAMREEVERAMGAPGVFLQGACGDLGPREGFVGDPAVADRNGRQLAYAALSALESLGPPATDLQYAGPVVSGATLGTWARVPFSDERWERVARFAGGMYRVDLPLKPRPDRAALQEELEQWQIRQRAAEAATPPAPPYEGGDRGEVEARDCGARAERARRWLARLADLPEGTTYPLRFSVHQMGEAVWITCGGEPYNLAQAELRRRFPDLALVFSPLAGDLQVAYMLPAGRYGQGLYQEEPSILGPGCLETLIDAMAARIADL